MIAQRAAAEAAAREAERLRLQRLDRERRLFELAVGPVQPLVAPRRVHHPLRPVEPTPRQRLLDEQAVMREALSDELNLLALELRMGVKRELALRNLALRSGVDDISSFVAMLVQADRFGTNVAEALRIQAETMRTHRRLRAEERAAKIPLKLLFPLIFFIFPSLMVVLMGPAMISIYRVLLPTMGGR